MRLVDQDDLGHELAHDRQRQYPHILHRDAFGQRRAAERTVFAVQGIPERWVERGLRPDDLDCGLARAGGDRGAGNKPAAADGDHQRIEVGRVLQHLQCDGALARDHQRVVIGMDEGQAALAANGFGAKLRLRYRLALEHHLGAVRLRRLHLHEWRCHRHDDGGRNAQPGRVIGNRLRVVARRHGDDAAPALGCAQRCKLVEGAAILERVGNLEIFVFDVDFGSGQRRELGRRKHRRAQHLTRDGTPRCLDVGNSDAHASPRSRRRRGPLGTSVWRISGPPRAPVASRTQGQASAPSRKWRASGAKTIYAASAGWSRSIARIDSEDIWS